MINFFFNWTNRLIRWSLYALMAAIPFGNAPVEIFANAAAGLFLIEMIVKIFLARKQGCVFLGFFKNSFYAAVGFYIFFNLISVLGSVNIAQSVDAFLKKFLEGVFLFGACVTHVKERKQTALMLFFFFLGAFVMSVNGLFQWFSGRDFIRGSTAFFAHDGRRISGAFKHPNGFAGYLICVIPLALAMLMYPPWRKEEGGPGSRSLGTKPMKGLLIILLVLSLAALGLTFSRGAWLGLFAGVVFLSIGNKRNILLYVGGIALFLAIFLPLFFLQRPQQKNALQNVVMADINRKEAVVLPRGDNDDNGIAGRITVKRFWEGASSGRAAFWRDAFGIAREHPWFGTGLNTYTEVLKKRPDAVQGFYAHNCYLQMAAELGFVGLGSFLLMITAFFFEFAVIIPAVSDRFLKAVAWGIAASLAAFFVHAFFDTIMYTVQLGIIHWLLMGFLTAVVAISPNEH